MKGKKDPKTTASPSVIDCAPPKNLDKQIYVLYGTNIRPLSGCLGICSPGIVEPCFMVSEPFWKAIRSTLLSVCNTNLLTSEK